MVIFLVPRKGLASPRLVRLWRKPQSSIVPTERIELSCSFERSALNAVCLPIPPHRPHHRGIIRLLNIFLSGMYHILWMHACLSSEHSFDPPHLFFERPLIRILALVPGGFAVSFLLLIQVDADNEVAIFHLRVGVKSWKPASSEGSYEAHFFSILSLEDISRASEKGDRIFDAVFYDYFHMSECRESNPGYTHPKRA